MLVAIGSKLICTYISYSLFVPIFVLFSSIINYFELCQFSDFQCAHLLYYITKYTTFMCANFRAFVI